MASDYLYQSGFGNTFQTESLPGASSKEKKTALKKWPHGLYAEQLSGSAFTAPKGKLILLVLSN